MRYQTTQPLMWNVGCSNHRAILRFVAIAGLLFTFSFLIGCGGSGGDIPVAAVSSQPATAMDALFRSDPSWLGGVGTHSVDLGGGRVLWLFGRSFVDPLGQGDRALASEVDNSIAIQTGIDPVTATLSFSWGTNSGNGPEAFFPGDSTTWLTPRAGILDQQELTLFFLREREPLPTDPPVIGATPVASVCLRVLNPQDVPGNWIYAELDLPTTAFPVFYGSSLERAGGHVYCFALNGEYESTEVLLLRWTEQDFAAGLLDNPEWLDGVNGWLPHSTTMPRPLSIFEGVTTEYSAHAVDDLNMHVAVQNHHFLDRRIAVREASMREGPWTDCLIAYAPPEVNRLDAHVFGAKAHQVSTTADLLISYQAIATTRSAELTDMTLGYPRFVLVDYD